LEVDGQASGDEDVVGLGGHQVASGGPLVALQQHRPFPLKSNQLLLQQLLPLLETPQGVVRLEKASASLGQRRPLCTKKTALKFGFLYDPQLTNIVKRNLRKSEFFNLNEP